MLHHRQDHWPDADSPTHVGTDGEPHSRTYRDGASGADWHCTTHRGAYAAAHRRYCNARGDVDRHCDARNDVDRYCHAHDDVDR